MYIQQLRIVGCYVHVQWNLFIMVTLGPSVFDFYIQVAVSTEDFHKVVTGNFVDFTCIDSLYSLYRLTGLNSKLAYCYCYCTLIILVYLLLHQQP